MCPPIDIYSHCEIFTGSNFEDNTDDNKMYEAMYVVTCMYQQKANIPFTKVSFSDKIIGICPGPQPNS